MRLKTSYVGKNTRKDENWHRIWMKSQDADKAKIDLACFIDEESKLHLAVIREEEAMESNRTNEDLIRENSALKLEVEALRIRIDLAEQALKGKSRAGSSAILAENPVISPNARPRNPGQACEQPWQSQDTSSEQAQIVQAKAPQLRSKLRRLSRIKRALARLAKLLRLSRIKRVLARLAKLLRLSRIKRVLAWLAS
jgi:hypothetical protein